MKCAEFQKVLPEIIDSGNIDTHEHLQSCKVCSDLVADLRYIAEQAKLLVPMMDPSPKVWDGIQTSLEREGLVRPASGTTRFPAPIAFVPGRRGTAVRLAAFAALLLIAIGLITYHGSKSNRSAESAAYPVAGAPPVAAVDDEDSQLLQAIAQRAPAMRASYEDSLKSVNAYIADAKKAVAEDPDDQQAKDHLLSAYDQKAMLYQMALSRSLE